MNHLPSDTVPHHHEHLKTFTTPLIAEVTLA